MQLTERTWTNDEVAALIDRDPKTLNTWAQRGWIYASESDKPGRGRSRTFDYPGVIHVLLTDDLAQMGMNLGDAAYCSREWCYKPTIDPKHFATGDHMSPLELFEGERTYLVTLHGSSIDREVNDTTGGGRFSAIVLPESAVMVDNVTDFMVNGALNPRYALAQGGRVSLYDLTNFMEWAHRKLVTADAEAAK